MNRSGFALGLWALCVVAGCSVQSTAENGSDAAQDEPGDRRQEEAVDAVVAEASATDAPVRRALWRNRTPDYSAASWPSNDFLTMHAAFDASTAKTVVFGPVKGGSGGVVGTWEWDGVAGTFAERQVTTEGTYCPGIRRGGALAFDAGSGAVLFTGGYSKMNPNGKVDVWEWSHDRGEWSLVLAEPTAGIGPPVGAYLVSCEDPFRNALWFYSPVPVAGGLPSAAMWEWKRSSLEWVVHSVELPSWIHWGRVVLAPRGDGPEIFVGVTDTKSHLWSWTDPKTIEVSAGTFPDWPSIFRNDEGSVYMFWDQKRRRVILPEGGGSRFTIWTWEFDPVNDVWINQTSDDAAQDWPKGTIEAAAYDSNRGVVVALVLTPWRLSAQIELWEWDGSALKN